MMISMPLYKRILVIFGAVFLSNPLYAESDALNGRFHTYARLLLNRDLQDIRVVSISAYRDPEVNTALLDCIAELALSKVYPVHSPLVPDTMAWVVKALSRKPERYAQVVATLRIEFSSLRKVQKEIAEYFQDVPLSDGEGTYIGGTLNLDELRESLRKNGESGKSAYSGHYAFANANFEKLHQDLGIPDFVDSFERKVRLGGITFAAPKFIDLVWKDYGIVRLSFDDDANQWVVHNASPFVLKMEVSVSNNEGMMGYPLLAADPELFNYHSENIFRKKYYSHAIAEFAAERLLATSLEPTEDEVEAHIRLCKILLMTRNGRFKTVAEFVANNTKSKELKEYAEKVFKKLSAYSGEPYQSSRLIDGV